MSRTGAMRAGAAAVLDSEEEGLAEKSGRRRSVIARQRNGDRAMRRIKEVLRLKYELGLGQRQNPRSCSIGQSTVHDYLRRAEIAGLRWPLTEEWDDGRIEVELFGRAAQPATPPLPRPLPDFAAIHDQLRQHRHLTLQLLWGSTNRRIPTVTATATFATIIRSGGTRLMSCFGRSIRRARSFLLMGLDSISRARPHRQSGLVDIALRCHPQSKFVNLCRGYARPTDGILDSVARPRL